MTRIGLPAAFLIMLVLSVWTEMAIAFSPVSERWEDYRSNQQQEAVRNYRQYRKAPARERRELEGQYERWREMPEQERRRIRRNYDRYMKMPPEEQQRFNRKYEEWKRESSE